MADRLPGTCDAQRDGPRYDAATPGGPWMNPMNLETLTQALPLRVVHGSPDLVVADITDDSRLVTPGCLFIARGLEDPANHPYTRDAVAKGAAAVLADAAPDQPAQGERVVWLVADTVDQALAGRVAEVFFGEPSKQLKLIGVTGTNGKTTTAYLVQHLLAAAGVRCGMIGTVEIDDGASRTPADLTTPGAIEMSRLLARMVANGCDAAVAEVSSHALHQGRTAALDINVGIFTNLTGDHLDYHGTMDAYADAKALLFEQLGEQAWAVVNQDDPSSERMIANTRAHVLRCTLTPSVDDPSDTPDPSLCRARVLKLGPDYSRAQFDGPWGSVDTRLPLVGRHNVANTLEAIAAANAVTALARQLRTALSQCPPVPGRLEPVRLPERDDTPAVLVDYAHTHDALENVLLALRPVTRGRLHVLFGCGGDRDRTKRPKMAAVACRLADRVVVTSDNPRTEDPHAIIREIMTGVPATDHAKVHVDADRAAAIRTIIHTAAPDDTVLIAGKGHEDYQILGTTKRHFDDREQAAAALEDWSTAQSAEKV